MLPLQHAGDGDPVGSCLSMAQGSIVNSTKLGIWYHIAVGIAAALSSWNTEVERNEEDERHVRMHGACSWCGEILFHPIHDLDCPARIGDRELMRKGSNVSDQ